MQRPSNNHRMKSLSSSCLCAVTSTLNDMSSVSRSICGFVLLCVAAVTTLIGSTVSVCSLSRLNRLAIARARHGNCWTISMMIAGLCSPKCMLSQWVSAGASGMNAPPPEFENDDVICCFGVKCIEVSAIAICTPKT